MNYTYRVVQISLFNTKCFCFVESNSVHDLLAIREDHLKNFCNMYSLDSQEQKSYHRIIQWVKKNYPEYLI